MVHQRQHTYLTHLQRSETAPQQGLHRVLLLKLAQNASKAVTS
jgi:hypothetical protein